MTYIPGNTCFRCVFEVPPPEGAIPTCRQAGVLGSVAGILGTIQATECLKYLTGLGSLLTNQLLKIDVLNVKFRAIHIKKNEDCPVCGKNPVITRLIDYEQQVCDLRDAHDD
jgi:molybdopterin/thiamine biosynthesis adenylyltransferase